MEKINLKIKKSAVLEIVEIIIILYAIFLFFLGIIIKNTELVLEVMIMLVVAIIFNYLNKDELIIKSEEIVSTKYGIIRYQDIEKINIKNNILQIKIINKEKQYKFYFSNNNKLEILKFSKYITSKL